VVTGDDLALVRLAMRRRLVSAARIREAVERKKWDEQNRTLAEILIAMGVLDAATVASLAKELTSNLARATVPSGGPTSARERATKITPKTDPGLAPSVVSEPPPKPEGGGPPRKIGRYDVIRLIGAGAMGAVYEARDRELDRTIALKLLAGEGAPTARAIARFRREAKLAARLDHPNIVRVYGAGMEDGHHFIAMDLVNGRSLAELVAVGEVSPRRAIHLARKIALAMSHAHDRGVLHRDLKPANVLVDEQGEPRVTDFGLAVLAEPDESDRLTRTGAAVGTPAYMSPEQARGELDQVDARSDIYSMGATLYEMLTGGPPFEAPTFLELAKKICDQAPVGPRKKNPETPLDLDTICLKALEKEKEARYQTAVAMAADLARLLEDTPIEAKRPTKGELAGRWAKRHRGVTATAAALALVGAAGFVKWFTLPAVLTVETRPAGATVILDGEDLGPSPVTGHTVRAGRHTLSFKLEGYDSQPLGDSVVDAGRGASIGRAFDLVPLKVTLVLTTVPQGANVELRPLDAPGAAIVSGTTSPAFEKRLPSGRYEVRIDSPGYVPFGPVAWSLEGKGGIEIPKGPVQLVKDEGWLDLEVDPRDALVHGTRGAIERDVPPADGRARLELGTGFYEVAVKKDGFLPWVRKGNVGVGTKWRASLPPLRSFSRPLGGRVVAEPVIGDLDGDGVPDVVLLEEDDVGRWLTLLGGGEATPRWRVRTDATRILPVLGDADQDGVLDVVIETTEGVEVRDGVSGDRLFALAVPRSASGDTHALAFTTSKGTLVVVGSYVGLGQPPSDIRAVWTGKTTGWAERTIKFPDALVGQRASAPVLASVVAPGGPDSELEEARKNYLIYAFRGRLVALPFEASDGPLAIADATSTPGAELASFERDEVVLCPERGPLSVHSFSPDKKDPRPVHWPQDARAAQAKLVHPRAIKRPDGTFAILVRDENARATVLLGWDPVHRELRELGRHVGEEALLLPGDERLGPPEDRAAPSPRPRRTDPSFWVRGSVFDLKSDAPVVERSGEAQAWALDGPLAVADLDGDGSSLVLAPSRDGRALVALAPAPPIRWLERLGSVADAVVSESPGGDPVIYAIARDRIPGRERLVALDARDGRTLFSVGAPAGAHALATIAGPHRRDVAVLGQGTLARYKGSDGTLVWQVKEVPDSATIAATNGDACDCGAEDDILLGDPTVLVAGKDGRVVFTLPGTNAAARGRLSPLALGGPGAKKTFARIPGDDDTTLLARFRTSDRQEWSVPVTAGAGPLVAVGAIESSAAPSLVLADGPALRRFATDGTEQTVLMPDGKKRPWISCRGRILSLGAASPEDPGSVLLALEDVSLAQTSYGQAESHVLVRAVGPDASAGDATLWTRPLPDGGRVPAGPVFFDEGRKAAILAPSGAIVLLRTRDGAWLGERRSPEGELLPWLRSFSLGKTTVLLALADQGQLIAFDATTREPPSLEDRLTKDSALPEERRLNLRELARLAGSEGILADRAVAALNQLSAQSSVAVLLVQAQARFDKGDVAGALAAASEACEREARLAPAVALRAKAQAAIAMKAKRFQDLRVPYEALDELAAERPRIAAAALTDVAEELRRLGRVQDDKDLTARRFADAALRASPVDRRARYVRALIHIARLPSNEKQPSKKSLEELVGARQDLGIALASAGVNRSGDDSELRALAALAALVAEDKARFHYYASGVTGPLREPLRQTAEADDAGHLKEASGALERILAEHPDWGAVVRYLLSRE
jgi:hypothetical protein